MTSTSEQFAYYVCDSVRQRQTNILTSPLLYSCCVLVPLMLLLQHYIINNDILTNINNYICYLYVCATHSAEYDVFPRYIWWSARRMDTLLDTNPTTKVCVRQDAKTNSGLLFGFGQSFFSRIARSFARNVGQADHPSGGQRAVRPCRTSETEYNGSQVQGTLIQMIDWFSFSLNNWSILLNQGRPRPRLHCSLLTRQWSQDKVFCQQRMSDWWCFLSKLEKKAVEVKPRRISLHQTTTKSMLCKDCIIVFKQNQWIHPRIFLVEPASKLISCIFDSGLVSMTRFVGQDFTETQVSDNPDRLDLVIVGQKKTPSKSCWAGWTKNIKKLNNTNSSLSDWS